MMGGAGVWMIWPLLVLVGLALLGLLAYRLVAARNDERFNDARTARQILDERYALGEIDEAEYQRRRAQLP